MARFIHRLGRFVEADEAFEAWMSADLDRMVAAMALRTNAIDRHFLLQSIVKETYRRRRDPRMRHLCIEVGRKHLVEFGDITAPLAADMGGKLPRVPSFAWLATALAENGQLNEAIATCEAAAHLGLEDGTKGGYLGRAARLRRTKQPPGADDRKCLGGASTE